MKAAVYQGGGKPLAIARIADPTPGRGQVVIRVHRCGICGSDLHMAESHSFSFQPGDVPGHEFAGEVVALGPGADGVAMSDRVAVMPLLSCGSCRACLSGQPTGCAARRMHGAQGVMGGYAEDALADARWCLALPKTLGFDYGALVEPLAVSLRAVQLSGIRAGDRVLVIGAGPIGIAAAYWARLSGAGRVAVSATSTRREAMARAVGADGFIIPEPARDLAGQAAEALGGEADIVFDCAGMPGSLDAAVAAVRSGGVVSAPGVCWSADTFTPMMAMIKEVALRFSFMYDRRQFETAIGALDSGRVEPRAMITEVVSLDEAPDTFEALKQRNNHCKVQIAPW